MKKKGKIPYLLVVFVISLLVIFSFDVINFNQTSATTVQQFETNGVKIPQIPNLIGPEVAQEPEFQDEVLQFLSKVQDRGDLDLPSMDHAYYLGMSIQMLSDLYSIPDIFIAEADELKQRVLAFVNQSRNPLDGGYGNWEGARSSMESTYQALSIYLAFGEISSIPLNQINETLIFLNSLKVPGGGYFPLSDWDVGDITSTFRALSLKADLKRYFPTLFFINDSDVTSYLEGNFVPPFFINDASGYAEIAGGRAELLASFYANSIFSLLGLENPHVDQIARYAASLTSPNGGVAGLAGGLPTTGFTAVGLKLYLQIQNSSQVAVDQIYPLNFISDVLNYISFNQDPLSGYTSSERDKTPELSSTFFVIDLINQIKQYGVSIDNIPIEGVFEFILFGNLPSFGYGDYPGDKGELSYTTMALIISKLLNSTIALADSVSQFIYDSFKESDGGFGFRPFTSARVKYTYYGIQALRSLSADISNAGSIRSFLLNSQTFDGGFGQFPTSILSYLSHTFWGLVGLNSIGELNYEQVNPTLINEFVDNLRSINGTYSNSRTSDPSIISTYRAIAIKEILNQSTELTESTKTHLLEFQRNDGGFSNNLDDSYSTMEATYYGVLLGLKYNLNLNYSRISSYIWSLRNEDGGFGLRIGFTSRMTSTYFAVLTLRLLANIDDNGNNTNADVSTMDIYSPIIIPSFLPSIDTNKTIQGTFQTSAIIRDPESMVVWAYVNVVYRTDEAEQAFVVDGLKDDESEDIWVFLMGPFPSDGFVSFQINAWDQNNNTSFTQFFSFKVLGFGSNPVEQSNPITTLQILKILPLLLFGFALSEAGLTYYLKKKKKLGDLKMNIQQSYVKPTLVDDSFNLVVILSIMLLISTLSRILMNDALIIVQGSLFLFRFMLAIFVILIIKYVIGIQSYGLFAPSVLVVALLSLGATWGILIFINIFFLLYVVRILLTPFSLPVGFRIGILMSFTITYLGFMELVGEIFRIPILSNTVFIPIIITPWIADRYVTDIQQNDNLSASKRLAVTLVITLSAYLFMRSDRLVSFVALNPETWVIMLAVLLYLAKYQNYTQIDRRRFDKLFAKDSKPLSLLIRNRNYIYKYNSQIIFPVINKYNLKNQFEKWRIPTPGTYKIIDDENGIKDFLKEIGKDDRMREGFVIKPSQSFGGFGIIVVNKVLDSQSVEISGEKYHIDALLAESKKIINGDYLTSQVTTDRDIIVVEEKITCNSKFAQISVGLPDIRVIVFRGIPIMSMARLPTIASQGKANLKQGAIGSAIQISTGKIYRSEWKKEEVTIHPDTQQSIRGFVFDKWNEMLAIASLAQKASGLGYAGVDLVWSDKNQILVLEVNKRPGLEIQNINSESLLQRMEFIEQQDLDVTAKSPLHAANLAVKLDKQNWSEL